MKVKVLRGFYGNEGRVARDALIEVDKQRAYQLMRRGLVAPVLGEAAAPPPVVTPPPAPAAAPVVEAEPVRPTQPPQTGFQTGGETPSSSSEAAPRQRKRPSRKGKSGRASSSSTKAGASRPGPTSSTPATGRGGATQEELPNSGD